MLVLTENRDDADYHCCHSFQDLVKHVIFSLCVQQITAELTKIHDQPNLPSVPLIKLIPNASRPENAPSCRLARHDFEPF
jgi:hypothetical protein